MVYWIDTVNTAIHLIAIFAMDMRNNISATIDMNFGWFDNFQTQGPHTPSNREI